MRLPHWQTLASAVGLAAALPPWDLAPLAFVALVPWLAAVARAPSLRAAAIQGFWLGFALALSTAHWLASGIHEFLQIGWPLAVAGLGVFAAGLAAPHWIAVGAVVRAASRGGARLSVWGAAAVVAGCGALDAFVPRLFDVGIGYALHDAPWLRQAADLGGVDGLGVAIVATNVALWQAVERARRGASVSLVAWAAFAAAVPIALASYGAHALGRVEAVPIDREVEVFAVQGNVENGTRLAWARGDDVAAERQLAAYSRPTEALITRAERPDLVVWPEATFPGIFRKPGSTVQRGRAAKFDRMVLRLDVPILFGAYDLVEGETRNTLFNSLFLITPSTGRRKSQGFVQTYRKHDLLPFAEAIPLLPESGWVQEVLPSFGAFGRGPGPVVLQFPDANGDPVRLAPIICSESIDGANAAAGVALGADLLLNVGSDGWFESEAQARFHLAIARMRSVETRRPQIRVANTGISALVLPSGDIPIRTEFDTAETMNARVPLANWGRTSRVAWGDWVGWACLAAGACFSAIEARRRVGRAE